MILLGGESPDIFRKGIEIIDSALPNSKIVELPGPQHLVHYTHPELLAREVLGFLKQFD